MAKVIAHVWRSRITLERATVEVDLDSTDIDRAGSPEKAAQAFIDETYSLDDDLGWRNEGEQTTFAAVSSATIVQDAEQSLSLQVAGGVTALRSAAAGFVVRVGRHRDLLNLRKFRSDDPEAKEARTNHVNS